MVKTTISLKRFHFLAVIVVNDSASATSAKFSSFAGDDDSHAAAFKIGSAIELRLNPKVTHFEQDRDISPVESSNAHIRRVTCIVPSEAATD